MPERWQLIRADALRVREWDDAGVIYDAFSGSTHLVDALGLELLDLLRQQAWSLDALVTELRDALPDDLDAEAAARLLRAKLEQLARLDLVTAA
ncbi:HPr-rel-A system PqqD family peptide chaperone [Roseateles sp. NT4]|uniref:HPr-rel-A system PqqD family peptide chaperone n=1 Tax=Roseateles sp. NT4 TaxID=3453715 RepID=UPI003EEB27E8